jgi:hypothetical protein
VRSDRLLFWDDDVANQAILHPLDDQVEGAHIAEGLHRQGWCKEKVDLF